MSIADVLLKWGTTALEHTRNEMGKMNTEYEMAYSRFEGKTTEELKKEYKKISGSSKRDLIRKKVIQNIVKERM